MANQASADLITIVGTIIKRHILTQSIDADELIKWVTDPIRAGDIVKYLVMLVTSWDTFQQAFVSSDHRDGSLASTSILMLIVSGIIKRNVSYSNQAFQPSPVIQKLLTIELYFIKPLVLHIEEKQLVYASWYHHYNEGMGMHLTKLNPITREHFIRLLTGNSELQQQETIDRMATQPY